VPKVLVIDDEALLRDTVRAVLEAAGYEVIEAADGESGLRLYREQGADLVLVDLFMPRRDGLEVIRDLLMEASDAKIIAISGGGRAGEADLLDVAVAFGAARALRKPIEPRALVTAARELLGVSGA
jgi:CheY-like chemotaxis protein